MNIKKWFMKTFMYEDYLANMMQENQISIEKTIRKLTCLTDRQKEKLLIGVENKKNQYIEELRNI